mmetsp:Transcript_27842/g.67697  ORF Transcript_27842/g.67697 Transcript_27842/m.67697 type:complete len:190 (-) Transcript_27842:294-863(-)
MKLLLTAFLLAAIPQSSTGAGFTRSLPSPHAPSSSSLSRRAAPQLLHHLHSRSRSSGNTKHLAAARAMKKGGYESAASKTPYSSRRHFSQAALTLATLASQGLVLRNARAERTDIPDCYNSCVKECTAIAPKSGDYCKDQCMTFCAGDPPTEVEVSAGVTPADNQLSRLDGTKQLKGVFDLYGQMFGRK